MYVYWVLFRMWAERVGFGVRLDGICDGREESCDRAAFTGD